MTLYLEKIFIVAVAWQLRRHHSDLALVDIAVVRGFEALSTFPATKSVGQRSAPPASGIE